MISAIPGVKPGFASRVLFTRSAAPPPGSTTFHNVESTSSSVPILYSGTPRLWSPGTMPKPIMSARFEGIINSVLSSNPYVRGSLIPICKTVPIDLTVVEVMVCPFPSALRFPSIGSNCFQTMPNRRASIAMSDIETIAKGRTTSEGTKSHDRLYTSKSGMTLHLGSDNLRVSRVVTCSASMSLTQDT